MKILMRGSKNFTDGRSFTKQGGPYPKKFSGFCQ